MQQQNYHCSVAANVTAMYATEAINNVPAWWGSDIDGETKNTGDTFTIHFGDTFVTFTITEMVPGKKVEWLVTDCCLPFQEDKHEWTNTHIRFDISNTDDTTTIDFMHIGLTPEVECYNMCIQGWDFYIKQSLFKLLTEGQGTPNVPRGERVVQLV